MPLLKLPVMPVNPGQHATPEQSDQHVDDLDEYFRNLSGTLKYNEIYTEGSINALELLFGDDYSAELEAEVVRLKTKAEAARILRESEPAPPIVRYTRAELDLLPQPKPLVEGLLYTDTVATFAAPGGLGKTMISLDWALCMGTAQQFLGRAVKQGRVLYIAAEGVNAFATRIRAWEESRGLELGSAGQNLTVQRGSDLNPAALRKLLAEHTAEPWDLIVFDTRSALFSLGSENDNAEMSRVVYTPAKAFRDAAPGTTVLILTHVTEQTAANGRKTYKLRGASSARDDSDTVLLGIPKSGKTFDLTTESEIGGKQRDAEEVTIKALHHVPVGGSTVIAVATAERLANIANEDYERISQIPDGKVLNNTELMQAAGFKDAGRPYRAWRDWAIAGGYVLEAEGNTRAKYTVSHAGPSEGAF